MNEAKISFERSLTRSMMLRHHCSLPEDSFESKMLKHTRIPGTLPLSVRSDPEDPVLLYDITSLLSVEKHFENRRIVWQDISVLIDSLGKLLRQLEAYLLPESYLSLDPRTLFLDPEKKTLLFALAPDASPDFSKALSRLLAWVLERIDYSSDATVVLAYRLHKESCREYCSIADLQKLVRIQTEKQRQQPMEDRQRSAADAKDPAAASTNVRKSTPGLSPDGIFRYRPAESSTAGAGIDSIPSEHAAGSPPLYASSAGREPEKAAADPKPGRPTPPPILADDWAEDDAPDYRFPAASLSHNAPASGSPTLNPADYAIDLNDSTAYPPADEERGGNAGSLLSFFRLKKGQKKEKEGSLKARLQTDRSDRSLKKRFLLCLLLMLAVPALLFLLKGPTLFRRLFPVILILELGIAVITAIDCLMLRMPEDE